MTNATISISDKEYRTQFNSLVTFYTYQKGLSVVDSEDLAQEVMAKAIRTFDEEKSQFQTHVYNVSQSKIIDFYRTQKEKMDSISKWDNDDSDNSPMQIADPSKYANGYDMLVNEDLGNRITSALDKLPTNIKLVMNEFYVNQLKIKEINAKYDIPTNTIKVYLSRGRKSIIKNFR